MMTGLAMINRDKAGTPAFLTLGYPDEALPVTERAVKRHLGAFRAAFLRRYGARPVLWRREQARRKSGARKGELQPHVHLLTWNVEPTAADRVWLAETWTRIVGCTDPEGRRKHEAVTVHRRSWFLPDSWAGVRAYVSKYCAKIGEEPCDGRSWGYWWRELLPVQLVSDEIPGDTFHPVRRVLRRYVERHSGRRVRLFTRWTGLTVFLSEATGAKLVRWAWEVGWRGERKSA